MKTTRTVCDFCGDEIVPTATAPEERGQYTVVVKYGFSQLDVCQICQDKMLAAVNEAAPTIEKKG